MILKEELKAAIGITHDSDDDWIEHVLEPAAVEYLRMRTGKYYGPPLDAAEYVVQGSSTGVLRLPQPFSAITSIASRAYEGATETAILTGDDDGWTLRILPGATHGVQVLRKGGALWSGALEYVVTGTIGYASGQEPATAKAVVHMLVDHWWHNRTYVTTGTVTPRVEEQLQALLWALSPIAV